MKVSVLIGASLQLEYHDALVLYQDQEYVLAN